MPAREAALQMLYALDLDRGQQTARQVEHWYEQAHPLAPAVAAEAKRLVSAVESKQEEIERLIEKHAIGWRLARMSVVDRCVLKLAAGELLAAQGGARRAAIQAALKLAQKFSQPEAVAFIQGLLEAVARELPAQDAVPAEVTPNAS